MTDIDTEPFIFFVPRRGQVLHLVRWMHTSLGWQSETRARNCLGSTESQWIVEISGLPVELDRREWAPLRLSSEV